MENFPTDPESLILHRSRVREGAWMASEEGSERPLPGWAIWGSLARIDGAETLVYDRHGVTVGAAAGERRNPLWGTPRGD